MVTPVRHSGPESPYELSAAQWEYASPTLSALGHHFAFRSTDVLAGRLIGELYRPCATEGEPDTWYSIVDFDDVPGGLLLYVDAECVALFESPARLLSYLTWHINQQVIAKSRDWVLLHAAAAAYGGLGLLLPARAEAGKTTLVAGLVNKGYRYLTDEVAAVSPDTLQINPYLKPLSIDPGSWAVLSNLAPPKQGRQAAFFEGQWQVNVHTPQSGDEIVSVFPAVIVFPTYQKGARTVVKPVSRSEALTLMMSQTFRFHEAGRRNVEVLARVLQAASCYRLISGNLDGACGAVTELMEDKIIEHRTVEERKEISFEG